MGFLTSLHDSATGSFPFLAVAVRGGGMSPVPCRGDVSAESEGLAGSLPCVGQEQVQRVLSTGTVGCLAALGVNQLISVHKHAIHSQEYHLWSSTCMDKKGSMRESRLLWRF